MTRTTRSRSGVVYSDEARRRGPEWHAVERPARDAEIVRRVRAGESMRAVARAMGMSSSRVRQIVTASARPGAGRVEG